MNKKDLKEIVLKVIDERSADIIAIGEKILANPEMGYREFETARLVKEELEKLSVRYRDGLAITGVRGTLAGRTHNAHVAVIGGFRGSLHSKDFSVADRVSAYVTPAKLMTLTVIDLLAYKAEKALEIKKSFTPKMTKEEYLAF